MKEAVGVNFMFDGLNKIFDNASPLNSEGKPKYQAIYGEWVKLEGLLLWACENSVGEGQRVLEHARAVARAYRLDAEFKESV